MPVAKVGLLLVSVGLGWVRIRVTRVGGKMEEEFETEEGGWFLSWNFGFGFTRKKSIHMHAEKARKHGLKSQRFQLGRCLLLGSTHVDVGALVSVVH